MRLEQILAQIAEAQALPLNGRRAAEISTLHKQLDAAWREYEAANASRLEDYRIRFPPERAKRVGQVIAA